MRIYNSTIDSLKAVEPSKAWKHLDETPDEDDPIEDAEDCLAGPHIYPGLVGIAIGLQPMIGV